MLTTRDFDSAVVEGIRAGDPEFLNRNPDGGLKCPLSSHEHEGLLGWIQGDYKKGTQPDDEHSFTFRVSPTFIHVDPLDNFIVGQDLIKHAVAGEWEKAETGRLGHENSEDALSWNVFRSLQEAGALQSVATALAGFEADGEPNLIFWGRRIFSEGSEPCTELDIALEQLEPTHRQRTEPDVVLHWPGQGWLFVEAKFTSPNTTYAKSPERVDEWLNRYAVACPDPFDIQAIRSADPASFPEQLLRNVAVASEVRQSGEQARVVSLSPRKMATAIAATLRRYLAPDSPVDFVEATWEDLYFTLPDNSDLAVLRDYMGTKTASLRKALEIPAVAQGLS